MICFACCWERVCVMFLHSIEKALLASAYNRKIHMSIKEKRNGELADIIQNNTPVICLCNFIDMNVSQVF